ncbi:lytic transglycosylase domain-containing protein [Sphingomonas sp. MMSM20]|uniref:lytic transglycosylase domain-containing protein n=1 Tax=Sphingomonas lycopersici TaxID=2951807 RepID=UPI00223762E7|nr:lytic transglycosylase domain-containing protein [Sphingomonas lycopersici]MCW6531370.1 lytic transglycosylase domain-containing protein [Sphingomonas lycopersici]
MTVNSIASATGRIQSAIQRAAARTGIDFDYLLGQAKVESGLNASASAATSSARGLYQFVEQSWLSVMKQHGAEYGLGWAANAISRGPSGRMTVSDAGTRQAILALRNNPEIASAMAAEHASDNKDALESATGRTATGTDLYMAHFLGLGGARQFLSTMQTNPGANAAALFPAAARANRGVFFNSDGSARSLSDVYQRFAAKLGDGAGNAGNTGNSLPGMQFAAQALDMDGATVITGANQSAGDALSWASAALSGRTAQTQTASLMKPTPDTARLAYLMLANLGG